MNEKCWDLNWDISLGFEPRALYSHFANSPLCDTKGMNAINLNPIRKVITIMQVLYKANI